MRGTVSGRTDLLSLVAGLALLVVGGVLLADERGALDLRVAGAAPLACAAVGAALLASGLTRGR
jgi:hypothetical protein